MTKPQNPRLRTKTKIHGVHANETAEYKVWSGMKARCLIPSATGYHNYGGRGIGVCDRWLKFLNFYADMGDRPSDYHSIERVDNDGDYCPENCEWATKLQQSINHRTRIDSPYKATGVTFHNGKFRARIQFDGKVTFLGSFHKKEEAIAARKEGEQKYWPTVLEP